MLLTKHCRPEVREWMLNGHFKIGSHKEYSKGEATGALSDTAEGTDEIAIKGDMNNFSGRIGAISFHNVSIVNSRSNNAVVSRNEINSLVFCASNGAYDPKRHAAIIEGVSSHSYPPNADLTAYLTLDGDKLHAALTAATDELFGVKTRWIGIPVSYGSRNEKFDGKNFKGFSDQELMRRLVRATARKPERFAVEEEFRFVFAFQPKNPLPETIYTKDLSECIHEAFRQTVVDIGDVRPAAV